MALNYQQFIWIIVSLLLIMPNAHSSTLFSTQLRDFIADENALGQGKLSRFKKLERSLAQYPLYPYQEYGELPRKLHKQKQIQHLLTQYADTPLATQLRNDWLDYPAKHDRWQSYLEFCKNKESVVIKKRLYSLKGIAESNATFPLTENRAEKQLAVDCDLPLDLNKNGL